MKTLFLAFDRTNRIERSKTIYISARKIRTAYDKAVRIFGTNQVAVDKATLAEKAEFNKLYKNTGVDYEC